MKTIEIEIRQQNENVQQYNLYVGYNKKLPQLHSMALGYDEARLLALDVIRANPEYMPKVIIDKY